MQRMSTSCVNADATMTDGHLYTQNISNNHHHQHQQQAIINNNNNSVNSINHNHEKALSDQEEANSKSNHQKPLQLTTQQKKTSTSSNSSPILNQRRQKRRPMVEGPAMDSRRHRPNPGHRGILPRRPSSQQPHSNHDTSSPVNVLPTPTNTTFRPLTPSPNETMDMIAHDSSGYYVNESIIDDAVIMENDRVRGHNDLEDLRDEDEDDNLQASAIADGHHDFGDEIDDEDIGEHDMSHRDIDEDEIDNDDDDDELRHRKSNARVAAVMAAAFANGAFGLNNNPSSSRASSPQSPNDRRTITPSPNRRHPHSTSSSSRAGKSVSPTVGGRRRRGYHHPITSSPTFLPGAAHQMQQLLQQHVFTPNQLQQLMKHPFYSPGSTYLNNNTTSNNHNNNSRSKAPVSNVTGVGTDVSRKQLEQNMQSLQEQLQVNLLQQSHLLQQQQQLANTSRASSAVPTLGSTPSGGGLATSPSATTKQEPHSNGKLWNSK